MGARPLVARTAPSTAPAGSLGDVTTRSLGVADKLGAVLSAAGRPLGVLAWLAVPLLFAASVLGLTALGGLLLDADWRVTLSIALFGPAAAITLVIGAGVEWMAAWQQWSIRLIYPAALFATGLALDHVAIPAPIAIAMGAPAIVTLVVLCARSRERPQEHRSSDTREKTVAA